MQKSAYAHGVDAYRANQWFDKNPFPRDTCAWQEWNRGYEAARDAERWFNRDRMEPFSVHSGL